MADQIVEKTVNNEQKQADIASKTESTDVELLLNRRARHFRHIGFAIFGGLAAALAGFLTYSALTAYADNEVYDPFTGEVVDLDK